MSVSVSVISVVIASVTAGLFQLLALFTVSRHLLPSQRFYPAQFDWAIVKELTRFGGWSSLYGFSGMIRKAADPIILNRLSTPLDVTCFHLGALIPNRLEVIVNQSFLGPVSPVIVGLHTERQDEKLKRIYLRLGRFAMWGLLFVIAPFLVHFKQIIILYVGETYLAAGTVMFLLLGCYPIVYGNILHRLLAVAKIRMRSMAIRESISAVVNLALTLVLVGYYQMGAVGSAISTFVVYGLGSILLFWPFGKNMVGVTWSEIWTEIFLPGILPFIAALLSMKLLAINYSAISWLGIAVNSIFGACVYLLVLWFVAKDIDKSQFRDTVLNLLGRNPGA
jgi:O-antigen/teichoic acid export membrane protein